MTVIAGKTVLITGASSGIGLAMASLCAARGNDLVVVARRRDRLITLKEQIESAHPVQVTVLPADLADPEGATHLLAELSRLGISVDVLVNNAGYSLAGCFEQRKLSEYFALMQVGLNSSMALIHGLLPGMLHRGYGRVLTISSVAGAMPAVKGHAVYSATKVFLIRLSLSLDLDSQDRNVRFSVACPGLVETEFHDRSGTATALKQSPSWLVMSPETAARKAFEALEDGRRYLVLGAANQLSIALMQCLPVSWGVRLADAFIH